MKGNVQIARKQSSSKLSLSKIILAKENFNHNMIIREKAYVVVYEGEISSRGSVTVKRFVQGVDWDLWILRNVEFNAKLCDFSLVEMFDNFKTRDSIVPAGTWDILHLNMSIPVFQPLKQMCIALVLWYWKQNLE